MNANLAFATLISTALLGSAATAQAPGGNGQPTATSEQSPTESGAPAGDSFVTKQSVNEWRAPKLVGVGVFGPDDKQIGKIKDVLMDHEGKAQAVVIGVGGFLGIGSKDVGVPFAALHWQTEGRVQPRTDQPPVNPAGSMTGGAPSSQPPATRTDPAATEASQGYPDKAVLDMTFAQLKSAPDFKYAPDPLADLDSRSSTSGSGPQRSSTP
jgi:hypothetical protein